MNFFAIKSNQIDQQPSQIMSSASKLPKSSSDAVVSPHSSMEGALFKAYLMSNKHGLSGAVGRSSAKNVSVLKRQNFTPATAVTSSIKRASPY